jgi:hypothetical protein
LTKVPHRAVDDSNRTLGCLVQAAGATFRLLDCSLIQPQGAIYLLVEF